MGFGMLRRYHQRQEETKAPEVEVGGVDRTEESLEAHIGEVQAEAVEDAQEAAAEGNTPESVHEVIEEGGAPEADPLTVEDIEVPAGRELPKGNASTDAWVEFAKSDPAGAPLDLTPREGLRDEIRAHYAE